MAHRIYLLNEQGQALLKTLVDPLSEFYIEAVMDLEEKMEDGDKPEFEGTVFSAEHFDEIKQGQK
jgi:hypothetical protein